MTTNDTERTATGSALVIALENVWAKIREQHPELPDVVVITGSGLLGGIPRWGHFWAERWQEREEQAMLVKSDRKAELFVAGERLACGAEPTVQTMLHEATHALAEVREIKDTSRQGRWHNRRFLELARELGLDHKDPDGKPHPTIGYSEVVLTDTARARYAAVIDQLESAIVAHLAAPTLVDVNGGDGEKGTRRVGGAGGTSRTAPKLVCGCDKPRIIRASRQVVELGPITCGLCHQDFTTEEAGPDEPTSGGGDDHDGQDSGETDVDETDAATPPEYRGTPWMPTVPEVSTKVRQLTSSNVRVLEAHRERLGLWTVARTFAVFHGSPVDALARMQDLMDEERAEHGGRWHVYCSLIAVRNKLAAAAKTWPVNDPRNVVPLTHYVEVQTGPAK